MLNFTKKEISILKKLNTPEKLQDFINAIPFNHELGGPTAKSPVRVLREGSAHCLEGAILAAYVLSLHGHKPLLLHLQTTPNDFEHVIALFKKGEFWGAISKTNHSVLRYRDPVYLSLRELVMSYFHEYTTNDGQKTLRKYSEALDLGAFAKGWEIESGDLWGIDAELGKIKHFDILPKGVRLRKADKIERLVGETVEWPILKARKKTLAKKYKNVV